METCEKCKTELAFSEKFDAAYCPSCNEWREKVCENGEPCEFCSDRPATPPGNKYVRTEHPGGLVLVVFELPNGDVISQTLKNGKVVEQIRYQIKESLDRLKNDGILLA